MPGVPRVMLLIETSRAYARCLLRGIAEYSRVHGPWSFQKKPYRYTWGGRRTTKDTLRRLKLSDIDGIVGLGIDARNLRRILRAGIPVVTQCPEEQMPGLINIVCDDEAIGAMAATHLLDRGFTNFAYCGFDEMTWSRRRSHSFAETIANAGFETCVYLQTKLRKDTWTGEQARIADWLKSLPKPVGVMACNDDRSEQVAEACKISGLGVPEQVAITGVDNDSLVCGLSHVPLSSVALSCEKAGYEAAGLLDKEMKREVLTQHTVLIRPTHVAMRQSTDVLAIEDKELAAAVSFIRQNCSRPIQVSDVVHAATLSRRTLEGRFREVLRRSVHDEIRRVRVAVVAKMLVETDLPISEIAEALNFPSAEHIGRYFRAEMKISPWAYRKQHRCGTRAADVRMVFQNSRRTPPKSR